MTARFMSAIKPHIPACLIFGLIASTALYIGVSEAMITPAEREQYATEQREKAAQRERELKIWWANCTADRDCLLKTMTDGPLEACRKKVEANATYDFRWIDTWKDHKFTLAGWRGDTRTAVYQGDLVEYQLQQGTWARHRYLCDFDIDTKTTTVTVERGRRAAS